MKNLMLVTVLLTMATTSSYCEHYGRVVYTAKKKNDSWVHRKPVILVKTKSSLGNKRIKVGDRQYMPRPTNARREYKSNQDSNPKVLQLRTIKVKSKKLNKTNEMIVQNNKNSRTVKGQQTEAISERQHMTMKPLYADYLSEPKYIPEPDNLSEPEKISEPVDLREADHLSESKHLTKPKHLSEVTHFPEAKHLTETKHLSEPEHLTKPGHLSNAVRLPEAEHLRETEQLSEPAHLQEPELKQVPEPEENQADDVNYVEVVTPGNNENIEFQESVINFYFDEKSYDDLIRKKVIKAFKEIKDSSCLKFESLAEKPTEESGFWIHITNPDNDRSCHHETVKKETGEIVATLGLDCLRQQQILHTLLHAIGLRDEISHPSRDRYVQVVFENIKPEYHELFHIDENGHTSLVEFDPISVMQFNDRAFSKNGRATVVPLLPGMFITPSEHLSHLDKLKLKVKFAHLCKNKKTNPSLKSCKKRPTTKENSKKE